MSRKSKFAGLAGALKEKASGAQEKPAKVTKSKSPDYQQTTVYLHRQDVYAPLQSALATEQLEYSQLVEDLLRGWLRGRKS